MGEASRAEKPAEPDGDGLVAHYELDGNFSDISGPLPAWPDDRRASPTFDAGKVGRAASFDGDTEVSFGNVGGFDRGEPFSLAVWLKGRGNLPMAAFQKLDERRAPPRLRVALRRHRARRHPEVGGAPHRPHRFRRAPTARSSSAPGSACGSATGITSRVTYDGSGKAAGLAIYLNGERLDAEVVRDTLRGSVED